MRLPSLFARALAGLVTVAVVDPAPAQPLMDTPCAGTDFAGRHARNRLHLVQEAWVKAEHAQLYIGPLVRCMKRGVLVGRDAHPSAHYRIDGWICVVHVDREGDEQRSRLQEGDPGPVGVRGGVEETHGQTFRSSGASQ